MNKGVWVDGVYYLPEKFDHITRKKRFKNFVDKTEPAPPKPGIAKLGGVLGETAGFLTVCALAVMVLSHDYIWGGFSWFWGN